MNKRALQPEEETVTVDGRPVHYYSIRPEVSNNAGEDIPLLLIHGLGCSADAWKPALSALAPSGRRIVAADMPGYGSSPGAASTLGMDALAGWNTRLLETLGIARAHILGNSMGCQVALAMAHCHPERVGGLVLVGPTTGTRIVPFHRYLTGLIHDGFREPLRYNLTLARMMWQMGLRRYFATVGKMMEDDAIRRTGHIAAPCLIIRGERDAIVSEPVARRLAEALPRGELKTLPGTAHAAQFNRPEAFAALALSFLAENELQNTAARRKR